MHQHLNMRKITSKWVTHELPEHNKKERVCICKENSARLEAGEWRLCDIIIIIIITGDEYWIYLRPIGRKQQNESWVPRGESSRTVVKKADLRRNGNIKFFGVLVFGFWI